jgi:glycosyltransferase involved in cell wall biosynthesis
VQSIAPPGRAETELSKGSSQRRLFLGVTIPGSTQLLRGQAAWFGERGYDVHLICPDGPEASRYCKKEGCTHHPVSIARRIDPIRDLVTLWHLFRLFRRYRPDVVNVGTPKMGLLGTLAGFLARVPRRIFTCRGLRYEHEKGLMRRVLMFTEWLSGTFAHKIVCVGPVLRERAVADGVFSERKAVVIGDGSSNGVRLDRYNPSQVDQALKASLVEELSLEGRFVFGFVGRLVDRKGINELVAAFDRLYQENDNIRLLLLGADDPSQLSDPDILEFIKQHPAIRRMGFFKDVPTAMSLMDVFVLPSWWEGFGNSYLEAACMGLPIVGSTGTGCRDAVQDGFNGVHVRVRDADAVYQAMKRYLNDSELGQRHGANGPIWADRFRPELIWQGLRNIYGSSAESVGEFSLR